MNEDYIPISLVAHTAFCPRRAWLEAVGEKSDSWQMQVGHSDHRRADEGKGGRSIEHRSVPIWSDELRVTGICDVVRGEEGTPLRVVEFKATPVRLHAVVTEAIRTQLALQTMCLQHMGHETDGASVFFTTHHRRVDVDLDDDDYLRARHLVGETERVSRAATPPHPLEDDPKCMKCSHVGICLPDERAETEVHRRILVPNPGTQVIHLATPGSRASISRGQLVVNHKGEQLAAVPLERIQGLILHGNIDLSGAAIREMLWRDLTIVWCTGGGRITGWSRPAYSANGLARVQQHVASAEGRLGLAREFVTAKIGNQATLLRRNGNAKAAVASLRGLQRSARLARTVGELFGVEGAAAAIYFDEFATMLSDKADEQFRRQWQGRVGRGAGDALNVALNYAYALLVSEAIRAVVACGLDPHAGFLHSSNRNKPALALDLMEEFRSPVAESAVIRAVNNRELLPRHFSSALGGSRLTTDGRKVLIRAFEVRALTEFTHPVFKYKVTWRRAIEIQARMVLGYLDSTQRTYAGIIVR